jgi:integrase/recombinase XerC
VLSKGRWQWSVPSGRKASLALERSMRVHGRHRDAGQEWLWLGQKGRLTFDGLHQMLRRRGKTAGLPELHAHRLRHTFARERMAQGGAETDLMRLA